MKTQLIAIDKLRSSLEDRVIQATFRVAIALKRFSKSRLYRAVADQRGDVPGWVLVVLMTTGLVTAIWTIAAPRLTAILKNSLDSMNGIR